MVRPGQDCPNAAAHTECPEGYVDWHEWADRMAATGHRQELCPGCDRWSIWVAEAHAVS